jgi:putative transcriptional regulator
MTIKWRLRQVMADRRITNKTLGDAIGRHPNSISYLKRTDTMPRLDEELLESLCWALDCDISDLLVRVPDNDAA